MNKRALVVTAAAVVALAIGLAGAGEGRGSGTPIYLDRSYSPAERAADLVSRMTLAQKASQAITNMAPAIPSLGVSAYGWWNEAAHGVSCETLTNNSNCTSLTNTTSYPVSLALASTWNPQLANQEASLISDEAREVETGNTENMTFFAPVVNMMRDPRWGRTDETFSEDPFLMAQMASQFVDGMQGQDASGRPLAAGGGYLKAIATLKHYALNNSEADRLTGTANTDDRTIREYYTKQFRDIVAAAHPGSVMSSYNSVNGVPSPANVYLIDTLMRETFGFQGYMVSDCDAIYEIQNGHHWQPPGASAPLDSVERHAFAMSAGEDLNCNTGYHDSANYSTALPTAVANAVPTQTDTFNENDVDTSLVRLFTARMRLGEFDDSGNDVPWVQQARARVPQGSWTNSDANNAVTETPDRLAMARHVADQTIVLLKNSGGLLPLHVPASGPYSVAVIGYFANPSTMYLGDYSSSQGPHGVLNEVNGYQGLKSAIQAIDPLARVDWYPGVVGGTSASQLTTVDPASVNAAAAYDAVVVYVGTDASTGTEAKDRSNIDLPGAQASLISQVAAKNPNTIVYMETDGPVDVTSFEPSVPAMLWSSFNGMRKGEALADVILGSVDPSGRLPFTWYRHTSDLPPMTDYGIRASQSSPGRTYMYFRGPVSYPFGFGLGYTTFSYSNLSVSPTAVSPSSTLRVSATVTNTGSVAGSDVVELYVATPDSDPSLARPAKRLEGFQKVELAPGASKTVTLTLPVSKLGFYDGAAHRWTVDQGRYAIQIADSSADSDVRLQQVVNVRGSLNPQLAVVTVKPTMSGDAPNGIVSRVFFPSGTVVVPNVTVAMSDDTLYGYVTKGKSRPLPRGMQVSYSSDRPSVVSVANGQIRTVGVGVATVTVTATYYGVTRTTSFVVDVTG
jgi:beta-glucosidase